MVVGGRAGQGIGRNGEGVHLPPGPASSVVDQQWLREGVPLSPDLSVLSKVDEVCPSWVNRTLTRLTARIVGKVITGDKLRRVYELQTVL